MIDYNGFFRFEKRSVMRRLLYPCCDNVAQLCQSLMQLQNSKYIDHCCICF